MADRHAGEQHALGWQREELADRLGKGCPAFLRAAVEPLGAQQQHHGLQQHAQIGPLRRSHAAVDAAEQCQRRAEELVVAGEPAQAREAVLARHAQALVHLLAHGMAAIAIGWRQLARIDVVFAAFAARCLLQALAHQRLECVEPLATHDMQVPGLEVAARGGTQRLFEHAADDRRGHWRGEEIAHRTAAGDGFLDVHGRLIGERVAGRRGREGRS